MHSQNSNSISTLLWIKDRVEIIDLVLGCAYAMDTQDWPLLRTCFTDEIHLDYSALRGEPPQVITADDFVAKRVKDLTSLNLQHISTNHRVSINGDSAACTSCFLIHRAHPVSKRSFDTAGHYRHGFLRTEAGWRITAITQTVVWNRGDPTIHGAFQ